MPRTPVFTRAYVTATRPLVRQRDPDELEAYVEKLARDMLAGKAAGTGGRCHSGRGRCR